MVLQSTPEMVLQSSLQKMKAYSDFIVSIIGVASRAAVLKWCYRARRKWCYRARCKCFHEHQSWSGATEYAGNGATEYGAVDVGIHASEDLTDAIIVGLVQMTHTHTYTQARIQRTNCNSIQLM